MFFVSFRGNSVHGVVEAAKRLFLLLGKLLRNLYNQCYEVIASDVLISERGDSLSF